jgi:hypothetical protein
MRKFLKMQILITSRIMIFMPLSSLEWILKNRRFISRMYTDLRNRYLLLNF